ncbi:hypothetical protein H0H93_006495 [Arthromyces matolae]|nr:hypothetical protein H0H93_006495 [Arthromyces matolae]
MICYWCIRQQFSALFPTTMSSSSTSSTATSSRSRSTSDQGSSSTTSNSPSSSSSSTVPDFGFPSFTDPITATPTPSNSIGAGNGGPSSQQSSNNGTGNATLYLYTFLATLVLLLTVSAAIILRSLVVRRRHQQLIEDAIRNGTLMPPSPGGSGTFIFGGQIRPRVDLSKKPKMWEAFVGASSRDTTINASKRIGKAETVTEWEWDTIRPFAATYVEPPLSPPNEIELPAWRPPPSSTSFQRRVRGLFRPRGRREVPPSSTQSEYPMTPTNNQTPTTAAPLMNVDGTTSATTPSIPDPLPPPPPPPPPAQKLRVAVLIAMPHPPEPNSNLHAPSSSPSSSSSSSSAAPPPPAPQLMGDDDDEPELPHLEFGITELEMTIHPSLQLNQGKDIRASVASGSSDLRS